MDPRIEALRSTTFFGCRLTRQQISKIQATVAAFPALSRHELGQTIFEQLGWRTGTGTNRIQLCQRLMEELERLGHVVLPAKDASYARGPRKPIEKSQRTEAEPAIAEPLGALLPLQLRLVLDEGKVSEWNEFVDRWHYAGFRHPLGPRLRNFVEDRHGRKLGCLLFSQAVVSLPCRDAWIGWPEDGWKAQLERVVGNTRFLLFPWVEVRNLASKVLSMALRRLADDWEQQHGCRRCWWRLSRTRVAPMAPATVPRTGSVSARPGAARGKRPNGSTSIRRPRTSGRFSCMARNAPRRGARRRRGRHRRSPQTTPSCSPGRNSSARQPRLRLRTTVSGDSGGGSSTPCWWCSSSIG